MAEQKCGLGVKVNRLEKGVWSFGSGLSYSFNETYIFINFLFWTIFIGWINK